MWTFDRIVGRNEVVTQQNLTKNRTLVSNITAEIIKQNYSTHTLYSNSQKKAKYMRRNVG